MATNKTLRSQEQDPYLEGWQRYSYTCKPEDFGDLQNSPIPFKIFQINQGCEGSALRLENFCDRQLIIYSTVPFLISFALPDQVVVPLRGPLQSCDKSLRHTLSYFHPDALEIT